MGTNYYLHFKPNLMEKLKGKEEEVLHIGKSSGGWCFALKVYAELNIKSLKDWYKAWTKNNNYIEDEYGHIVSVEEMIDIITNRSWPHQRQFPLGHYQSLDHYLQINNAVLGPNNLLRAKPGGMCLGPGPGTWDLFVGNFS